MYTLPFFKDLQALTIVPANPSPGKRKKPIKKTRGRRMTRKMH